MKRIDYFMEDAEKAFERYIENPSRYLLLEAYTYSTMALALAAKKNESDVWTYDEILDINMFLWDLVLFME